METTKLYYLRRNDGTQTLLKILKTLIFKLTSLSAMERWTHHLQDKVLRARKAVVITVIKFF